MNEGFERIEVDALSSLQRAIGRSFMIPRQFFERPPSSISIAQLQNAAHLDMIDKQRKTFASEWNRQARRLWLEYFTPSPSLWSLILRTIKASKAKKLRLARPLSKPRSKKKRSLKKWRKLRRERADIIERHMSRVLIARDRSFDMRDAQVTK